MKAKKTRAATPKEMALAKRLVKAAGFECTKQSCGKVGACAILCEDLRCDTLKARVSPVPLKAGWCPTQVICKPVKCGEVKCGSMKQ